MVTRPRRGGQRDFGSVIDANMDCELLITVIATGFGHAQPPLAGPRASARRSTGARKAGSARSVGV
jgi:hypothetical protein